VPFATAPVTYAYDGSGFFVTRRHSDDSALCRLGSGSRNILAALGVDKAMQRKLSTIDAIRDVGAAEYRIAHEQHESSTVLVDRLPWYGLLPRYRSLLEAAWSTRTMHPSYLSEAGKRSGSTGQCGVSSVWLVRELRTVFQVEANYCYGRLSFRQQHIGAVNHHCWVEVGEPTNPRRIVVDLTCDQAQGLDQQIMCETFDRLQSRGVIYESHARLTLDQLHSDRVWHRFAALDDAVMLGQEVNGMPGLRRAG
jgi:hypothetical protein